MNLRKIYGKYLKEAVINHKKLEVIGKDALKFYLNNVGLIDQNFTYLLFDINSMEDGQEFEYSYEELEKIADDLIAGKDVVLD